VTHKVFYSSTYVAPSYAFDTTRKAGWIVDSLGYRPIEGVRLVEPNPLTADVVRETHSDDFVKAVRTGDPSSLASSQGFRWCRDLYASVMATNGGVVAAALAALEDGVAGSLSSGMHHARRDYGFGFCTFNGLVIAAREAIRAGCESVLILDLDAHGGGGTASLICDEVRISQLDLVVDPFDLHQDAIDLSKQGPIDYLTVLEASLKGLRPGLCIYNAGMDVLYGDCGPVGFDARVVAARESIVFSWAAENSIPIAYTLAGGYTSKSRSKEELIAHHRCTIRAASHYHSLRKDLACQTP
jgi:acetoin utilization deacetylase AcuC-like enzyme